MEKEIKEKMKIKELELAELKNKLEKIETCQHNWSEVETGEGEYDFQCYKCLMLKSELD